jgi:hypothetical protein
VFAEPADEDGQVHIEGDGNLLGHFEGWLPLPGEDHGNSGWADPGAEGYDTYVDELAAEQHTLGSGPGLYAAPRLVIFTFCIFPGHSPSPVNCGLLLEEPGIRHCSVEYSAGAKCSDYTLQPGINREDQSFRTNISRGASVREDRPLCFYPKDRGMVSGTIRADPSPPSPLFSVLLLIFAASFVAVGSPFHRSYPNHRPPGRRN